MEVWFRSFSFLNGWFVGEPAVDLPGCIGGVGKINQKWPEKSSTCEVSWQQTSLIEWRCCKRWSILSFSPTSKGSWQKRQTNSNLRSWWYLKKRLKQRMNSFLPHLCFSMILCRFFCGCFPMFSLYFPHLPSQRLAAHLLFFLGKDSPIGALPFQNLGCGDEDGKPPWWLEYLPTWMTWMP